MAVDRTGPGGAQVTDIGVVVADAWQGRGLGLTLMRALVTRARARGVALLEMDVLNGNRQVIDMITSHWPAARVERSADSTSIRIRLQQHRQPALFSQYSVTLSRMSSRVLDEALDCPL
jgi:GNAT superfamily N-acetyltransferase